MIHRPYRKGGHGRPMKRLIRSGLASIEWVLIKDDFHMDRIMVILWNVFQCLEGWAGLVYVEISVNQDACMAVGAADVHETPNKRDMPPAVFVGKRSMPTGGSYLREQVGSHRIDVIALSRIQGTARL